MTFFMPSMAPGKSAWGGALVACATGCSVLVHCGGSDPCADYVCGGAAPDASDSGDAATVAPSTPDASGSEGGSRDAPPTVCDPTKSPSEDACVVRDVFGVFVAIDGDDASPGTHDSPVQTFVRAVQLARTTNRPRIFVCQATYAAPLTLTGAATDADLAIYGGFSCATDVKQTTGAASRTWAYDPGTRARIAPTSPGVALVVTDLAAPLRLEDLTFESMDAADPGASSVAALFTGSRDVVLARVLFAAGKGAAGADGVTSSAPLGSAVRGADASISSSSPPAYPAAAASVCSFGWSAGGVGEKGDPYVLATPGTPTYATSQSPRQTAAGCYSGADGTGGVDGEPAGKTRPLGTLTAAGWKPAEGTPGGPGSPGQGGGGGSIILRDGCGAYGGGGGSGGCGGGAASPGRSGGSSIALAAVDSNLRILGSLLRASAGGRGGQGASGQDGALGAPGGAMVITASCSIGTAYLCGGGAGGKGGKGGASGGGAGGISAGVAWTGSTPPMLDDASLANVVVGAPGSGGSGGASGLNDGPNGIAGKTLKP